MSHKITIGVKARALGAKEVTIPLVVPGQVGLKALRDGGKPTKQQIGIAVKHEIRRRKNFQSRFKK